jgi:tetratricopeptide (TPR) repeat protein
LTVLAGLAAPLYPAVRAWQDTISLPTQVENAADPAPAFDALPSQGAWWYPYAGRTNLISRRRTQQWLRLNLENKYLSCAILPDWGGRLYSCTDKLNGHPMFYANTAIKEALPRNRGGWAAAGVSLNFPVSPGRDALSPVDFGMVQRDGLAIVWVGETDRVTGLEWTVQFALKADSALLEQRVILRNPTSVRQPYSWWSDAAIGLEAGSRFVMPAYLRVAESSNIVDAWPVNSSHLDESVTMHSQEPSGFVAYGSRETFLAVYHSSSKTATVHFADSAVAGKKVATWGTRQALRFRQAFSDDKTQFVQLQVGLLASPGEFRFLEPSQSLEFTEYWMPARTLGGVSRANADAILNLQRTQSTGAAALLVELNVTHPLAGARIRVLKNSTPVLEETADLNPAATFSRSVPRAEAEAYRFELRDSSGKILLQHTEGEYDATVQAEAVRGPQRSRSAAPRSEADYLSAGTADEFNSRFAAAEALYREGIAQARSSTALKKAAGRLDVMRMRFSQGIRQLSEVVAATPTDAEAHYYLGVARRHSGQDAVALKDWEAAQADPEFGTAATAEIAASQARAGRADEALATLQKLLAKQPSLLRAGRMQVTLLRRSGTDAAARERLAYWSNLAPLDPYLLVEQAWLGQADKDLWAHLAANVERVLQIADQYMDAGFYADATRVLEQAFPPVAEDRHEPGSVPAGASPLAHYYRGYCRRRLGQRATEDFHAASTLPLVYSFPHLASSFAVLRAALEENPRDASAHWLLGLLYMNSNLPQEAVASWRAALAQLDKGGRTPRPGDPFAGIDDILRKLAGLPKANSAPKTSAPPPVAPPSPAPAAALHTVVTQMPPHEAAASALLAAAAGRLDEAQSYFNKRNFPAERQPADIRSAYLEIQLQNLRGQVIRHRCAQALAGIDAIGIENQDLPFTASGFGDLMKAARVQYSLGDVEFACGDARAARGRWRRVVKIKADPSSADFAFPVLAAARLEDKQARSMAEAALAAVNGLLESAAPESRGTLLYSRGILLSVLQQPEEARLAFQEGSRASDRTGSQYLNLRALYEMR